MQVVSLAKALGTEEACVIDKRELQIGTMQEIAIQRYFSIGDR